MATTKAEKQAKLRSQYADLFIRNEVGKAVLRDLMDEANFLNGTFVSGDSHAMAHREGQRSLILYILNQLQFANVQTAQEVLEQGTLHRLETEGDPIERINAL